MIEKTLKLHDIFCTNLHFRPGNLKFANLLFFVKIIVSKIISIERMKTGYDLWHKFIS